MASELTVQARITFVKGQASLDEKTSRTVTITGTRCCDYVASIATSDTPLGFGDMTSTGVGYVMLQNLDPTNYVEVTFDAGSTYPIKLEAGSSGYPGGTALFPNNGKTIKCKANGGACDVSIRAVIL